MLPSIVPVVDGVSEVGSIPVLMRRLLVECGNPPVRIERPYRVQRYRVVKHGELERAIELARRRPGCRAIAIVLDAEDDCPKQLAPELLRRASTVAPGTNLSVVLRKIETESWFIGSIESLRGFRGIRHDAVPPADPETIRDAKGYLRNQMEAASTYLSVDDQPAFMQTFDISLAYQRCRSFRKFRDDFCHLVSLLVPTRND